MAAFEASADLVDLELFARVADAGTIAAGAAASGMAAASASERLRALEARLGVALLRRGARGVAPTAAGAALLAHARRVLDQLDALRDELAAHRDGRAGALRLLANTAACRELLPDALAGFLPACPGIAVELGERRSEEIVDMLARGAGVLGIVSDAVDRRGLQERPLRADPLALVVAAGHPLARAAAAGRGAGLALADALAQPFVGLERGSALQEHVDAQARRAGAAPDYRARVPGLEAVCRLAGRGLGVGVVPETVARRCGAAAGVRAVRLVDGWAQRRLLLVARSFGTLAPAARRLARHLQNACAIPPADASAVAQAGLRARRVPVGVPGGA